MWSKSEKLLLNCGKLFANSIYWKIWYRWYTNIFPNFWRHFTEFHINFEILTEAAVDLQMLVLKSEEKIMENVCGSDQL